MVMRWAHFALILALGLFCITLIAGDAAAPPASAANPTAQVGGGVATAPPNPSPKCCHCKPEAGKTTGGAACQKKDGDAAPTPGKDAAAGKDATSPSKGSSLQRYFAKHTLVWAMVVCLAIILLVIALRIFLS